MLLAQASICGQSLMNTSANRRLNGTVTNEGGESSCLRWMPPALPGTFVLQASPDPSIKDCLFILARATCSPLGRSYPNPLPETDRLRRS